MCLLSKTELETDSFLQLALFLGSMGLMEGRDNNHIRGKFEDIYNHALLANWKVWPLAQVRSVIP